MKCVSLSLSDAERGVCRWLAGFPVDVSPGLTTVVKQQEIGKVCVCVCVSQ